MEFREGDFVVGRYDAPYLITRPGVVCRVVAVLPEYIRVETGPDIDPALEFYECGSYVVDPKFFMLYDGNKNRDTFDAALQFLLLGGDV